MLIEGDIGNHQRCRTVGVALVHCLTLGGRLVAVLPDNVDTAFLRLERVGQVVDYHIENNRAERTVLCEPLHVAGGTLLVDILERNAALLHVRDRNSPVVESGTECDGSLCRIELPAVVVCLLVHALDEFVNLINDFSEADLHRHLVDFKFVD